MGNSSTELINDILLSSHAGLQLSVAQVDSLKNILNVSLSKYQVHSKNFNEIFIDHSDIQKTNDYYIDSYVKYLSMKGCTEKSLEMYHLELKNFLSWIKKDTLEIIYKDILEYLSYGKEEKKWNSQTYNTKLVIITGYFNFLEKEEYIIQNPTKKLEKAKVEKRKGDVLTPEQREILRSQCSNERDLAILDFLYSSGVRVSELVAINRSDVDFDKCHVKVFGKGQKWRDVYFSPICKVHLQNYLKTRDDNNDALFVSLRRPHNRLHNDGVRALLKRLQASAKLDNVKVSPHTFRRTIATDMLNRGANIEIVAEKLGHANIQTTKDCYAFMSQERFIAENNKYF